MNDMAQEADVAIASPTADYTARFITQPNPTGLANMAVVKSGDGSAVFACIINNAMAVQVWALSPAGDVTGLGTVHPVAQYDVSGLALTGEVGKVLIWLSGHYIGQPQTDRGNAVMACEIPYNFIPTMAGQGGQRVTLPGDVPVPQPGGGGTGMTVAELAAGLNTDHDLRAAFGNLITATLVGALTTNHDVRAALGGLVESAETALYNKDDPTTQHFRDEAAGFARDRAYEADIEAQKQEGK